MSYSTTFDVEIILTWLAAFLFIALIVLLLAPLT